MPTYEYKCTCCNRQIFEVTQRINDKPFTLCCECLTESLKRIISTTSFRLIGNGWEKDGYSKKL